MSGSGFDITSQYVNLTRKLDKWLHYLGESRIESCPDLMRNVSAMSSTLKNDAVRNGTKDLAKEVARLERISTGTTKEIFGRLYASHDLDEIEGAGSGTEVTQRAHEIISELNEFESLRRQVNGDPDFCALATSKLMDAVNKALPQMLDGMREEVKDEQRKKAQELLGMDTSKGPGSGDTPTGIDEFRAMVRSACTDAAKEVGEVKAAMAGLKPGMDAAPQMYGQQDTRRMELALQLKNNPKLKKLMMLAGRLRRMAEATRKERDPDGVGVITGVTRGNDIMRMLPSEMAMMKMPQMRTYQLVKMAERKMAEYRMEGEKKEGRGPMIAMLDTSSSMRNGDRALWASAAALSCLATAQEEKRACTVLGFNTTVSFIYTVDAEGNAWEYPSHSELDQRKAVEGGALEVSLRITSLRCSGGTDFDNPLQVAMNLDDELCIEAGKADLLMVTDGEAKVSDTVFDVVMEAKEEKEMRVYGLTVGGGSFSKAMNQLCDNIVDIDAAMGEEEVASALP